MRYYLTILWVTVSYTLFGQQTVIPIFDTVAVTFDVWDEPYRLRNAILDSVGEGPASTFAGFYLSFSGYSMEATKMLERDDPKTKLQRDRYRRFSEDYRAVPAVASILNDAEQHEIVIVNEAHHEPRHRVFTRQLLRGLYDRGYRHFGLESLVQNAGSDSLVDQSAYPGLNSGYFTREPQFAAMVAEAQRIGYRVFGYEAAGTSNPRQREIGQTRNIVDYRAAHPGGKLLLHVGYSHATEGDYGGDWEKAMAQRLADTTGLDPLTVNQTTFREMSDSTKEQHEYRDFAPRQSAVYVDDAGDPFNFDNDVRWYNRYVFHPRTTYRYGRPDYAFAFGQQAVLVDFSHIDTEGPWLVRAYGRGDEMATTVPRDVVEMDAQARTALALAPGKYRILSVSGDGKQRVAVITVK